MFYSFLNKYNITTPESFDVNLYCIGLYSNKKSINIKEKILINNTNYFTLQPISQHDKEICLIYAIIKLNNIDLTNYPNITKYYNKSLQTKLKLTNIYNNYFNKINKNSSYNKYTLDLITKYNIYINKSGMVLDILYNKNKNRTKIFEYLCMASYFAIESYYTQSTINTVVLELQGKHSRLKLSKINYICSIIENLGDFRHHILDEYNNKSNIKILLLKYSKYIYRIYYSVGHAFNNKTILNYASKINTHIIKYRNESDISKVDYSILNYNNSISFEKYITTFTNEILNYIEKLL
jgi:hypothetical protein